MRTPSLIACLTLLITVPGVASAAEAARPNLAGRVLHADRSPVAKATVFIYTAGPKVGPGNSLSVLLCRLRTEGADGCHRQIRDSRA